MSIQKVRAYFEQFGVADRIREFDVSSATVELAAVAVGVEGARIAKSLSFKVEDQPIIIVVAGDAKVDNSAYKKQFHTKAKMLTHEEAHTLIGHDVGGVCPFALPENVKVYLDVSLKRFGTVFPAEDRYGPVRRQEIAQSGLHYLALGHIHKRTVPQTAGRTVYAWPGCPEGRGFDELGEKGVYQGAVSDDGNVSLEFVPLARRRYEILEVDVTGREPLAAVEAALPPETARDLYRVLLTGETGEGGVDLNAMRETLAHRFYALELRDHTRMAEDVWRRAEEDSLRGLFLQSLRRRLGEAKTDQEREAITRAARFGLAALDHRDLG